MVFGSCMGVFEVLVALLSWVFEFRGIGRWIGAMLREFLFWCRCIEFQVFATGTVT